ncbi:hypothetical protein [Reyranella sp.]|uniref:hypothetical protein n=1 Tax=Reyranella sp. TaxID=1929291 RepID=UPI00122B826A|nr:hypothetical protein [Reyranella sp.]TAJ84561.1 MAG: hypothetical protein EPO50_17890 [Reyranella sp.]
MSDDASSGAPKDKTAQTPKSYERVTFPDGRQLVQVYDLRLSIPKDTGKHYHAKITFRDGQSDVKGILHNPKRHLANDGSGYIDCVYILVDQGNIPTVTLDAIQSVKVLEELSQAEYEAAVSEIKKMTNRK